jgi:hypothetical protein
MSDSAVVPDYRIIGHAKVRARPRPAGPYPLPVRPYPHTRAPKDTRFEAHAIGGIPFGGHSHPPGMGLTQEAAIDCTRTRAQELRSIGGAYRLLNPKAKPGGGLGVVFNQPTVGRSRPSTTPTLYPPPRSIHKGRFP